MTEEIRVSEEFQRFRLDLETQRRGDYISCYVRVYPADEDVDYLFRFDMHVHTYFAHAMLGAATNPDTARELTVAYARRWVHGLIQLARFAEGAHYVERRTTDWNPLFGAQDFNEDDLRDHLLLALRRKRRSEVGAGGLIGLDVLGVADVLGIRPDDVRGVLDELVLEGLAEEDGASMGHTAADGACTITGAGLVYLRESRAAAAAAPPFVSIDEIDSYARVREVPPADVRRLQNQDGVIDVPEALVKRAMCEIVGDRPEDFKDWGGERSDVFTDRVQYRGRRIQTAMLLKGHAGVGPVLYPAKLGKRGDQDMRLFTEPAWLMIVQFNGRIDSAVYQRLWTLAQHRSMAGERPSVCVIDGTDTARLLVAYGYIALDGALRG